MFSATFKNADEFKRAFDFVHQFVSQCNIVVSPSGLLFEGTDLGQMFCFQVKLPSTACSHYHCGEDDTLAISLDVFCKLLKGIGTSDTVTLGNANDDKLTLSFQQEGKSCQFHMNLFNLETETLQLPVMEFDQVVRLPFALLQSTIKQLSPMSELLEIEVECDRPCCVTFRTAHDSPFGRGSIVLSETAVSRVKHVSAIQFSMEMFRKFSATKLTDGEVLIEFKEDHPLKLSCNVGITANVECYMAPKLTG